MLWQGGVFVDVVDHRGISSDLRVYRREEEGEEIVNTRHTDASHDNKQH